MKQLLLLLLFTGLFFSASGQDYQLIKSNNQYLYEMAAGHAGLEVEEVEFDGDSIFWLASHWIYLPNEWGCAYPDSSSMLGRKIRMSTDGTTVIYTAHDETITLMTQRNPGDGPWLAYSATDGSFYVEAAVSERVAENILGVVDSVKTFSFQSYSSDGTANNPWIANLEVRIAKNAGLVHSPQWGAFPGYSEHPAVAGHFDLSGIEGQVGEQNIKWFQVFDFEPDDEVHTEISAFSYGQGSIQHILLKYLSRQDFTDSIVYEVEVTRWFYQGSFQDVNMEYQGTEIETHTIRNRPDFDALPGSPVGEGDLTLGNGSGTYYLQDAYEGFPAKYMPGGSAMFNQAGDGITLCFEYSIDWPWCYTSGNAYYVKGLGGPYRNCDDLGFAFNRSELMYFNKSGVEWGSPLSTSASERLTANAFKVYPNPASESFRLGLNEGSYPLQLEVYEIGGRLLKRYTVNGPDDVLPVDGLPAGMLLLQAREREGSMMFGKIVVQ